MSAPEEPGRVEAQEAAIETTRRRLASEMNELADRLKPAVVKQRAEARVRASVSAFVDLARRRPVLAASVAGAILAAGAGLVLWKRRRRES